MEMKYIDFLSMLAWKETHLGLKGWLIVATMVLLFRMWRSKVISRSNSWPVLGMLPPLLLNLHRLHDWLTEMLVDCGGSFLFINPVLALDGAVTCNPLDVEHIFKTRFYNYPKGAKFHKIFQELLGDGIFNSDDYLWELQRKTLSMQFKSNNHREFLLYSIQRLTQDRLLPTLELSSRKGSKIDLQDVLLRFTFDNICVLALGFDPGCLAPTFPDVPFARAFELVTEACSLRFALTESMWQLLKLLGVGKERQLPEALATIEKFANEVIAIRKLQISSKETQNDPPQLLDFLSSFMQLRDSKGDPYSDKFLRDVSINLILAGRDTSSLALTWFFWLLHKHPNVEANILEEISKIKSKRNAQPSNSIQDTSVTFTLEELKEMNYLHAALSESLRLYPSVPLEVKDSAGADTLPSGISIKKGGRVGISIYAMGRMESLWGKDCLEFKPERWLRGRTFKAEPTIKYMAFNAGPRLCLGREMAYIQMKSVSAAIIWRYSVRVVSGHPIAYRLSPTLYMKHGLLVTLHARDNSCETML
eukprot:c30477_g1_i1 orf=198-1796(+)